MSAAASRRIGQVTRTLFPSAVTAVRERHASSGGNNSGNCEDTRKPVVLIIGAGAGIGQSVAYKFAMEGYHACVARRGSGPGRLIGRGEETDATKELFQQFCDGVKTKGGSAEPFYFDGTKPEDVADAITKIERDIGPIHVAVYNIGAQVGSRSLEKTSYRIFEMAWRMGSLGAFALAKEVAPYMLSRGGGTIIYTSATAAYRGNAGQHAHTMAMAGRRHLAQSLNNELGPQGIHVAHVNIDGMVNAPETLGKLMPELFQEAVASKQPTEEIIEPDAVADTYYMLHKQPRSAWSFDMDIRPWTTSPWFNSP